MSIEGTTARRPARQGMTLVEVMGAMLLLAIVVIGGGAFIFQTSNTLARQARKRQALHLANDRLEELRATPVHALTNAIPRGFVGWVGKTGGVWRVSASRFYDELDWNGWRYRLETAVDYRALYLAATATVFYAISPALASAESVALETLVLPETYYYP